MPGRYESSHTARQLLEDWRTRGLIQEGQQEQIERFALDRATGRGLPLYVHVLVGVGALITGVFFIGFLANARIIDFDSKASLMVCGLILVGLAVPLAIAASQANDNPIMDSFLTQASFCIMGTGKVLFTNGMAMAFTPHEGWGASVALLLLTAATFRIFPVPLDRFLSSAAMFIAIFLSLVLEDSAAVPTWIVTNAYFAALLGIAAFLMTSRRIGKDYLPVAYAAIVALCAVVLFFAIKREVGTFGHRQDFSPAIVNISLAAALIALIGWAAGGMAKLKSEPLFVTSAGAACLGVVSAPGILLSIGLMILGYAQHDRVLLILGCLVAPVFLSLYYYNLDLTLMAKSGILVSSGGILLAGRAYMRYRGFDREA